MTCEKCEMIEAREGDVIYSDPHAHMVLPEDAVTEGHVRIYSKTHAEKIQDLEEEEVQHLFRAGNVAASILFEQLGAQGTNMILNEGTTFNHHVYLDVIARSEGDGFKFRWDPKEVSEQEIEDSQKRIKDRADLIGHEQPGTDEPVLEREKEKMDESNPMIEHLNKLP